MKLLSSLHKELLILSRDRIGLLLLFVMPTFLVVVITLVQHNASSITIDMLLVDEDNNSFTKNISQSLAKNSAIIINQHSTGSATEAERLVGAGKYQVALHIPKGTADILQKNTKGLLDTIKNKTKTAHLTLWFSPTIDSSIEIAARSAIMLSVQAVTTQTLFSEIGAMDKNSSLTGIFTEKTTLPPVDSLITIDERFSSIMNFAIRPTAVQQNVPAWAIFGIFFIAVPLAGSFLHEKQNGTLLRLAAMPVSHATIFAGKLLSYGIICMVQFGIIFSTGYFLLPFLGLPSFDSCGQWTGITLLLLAVSAAACSYGTLLGAWGKSYDQIAVFAPVSIVIAAAIGGIMVPSFSMPIFIREVGKISPLYWAQNGFYDLLLRGGGLRDIVPELGSLCFFAVVCFTTAYFAGLRR